MTSRRRVAHVTTPPLSDDDDRAAKRAHHARLHRHAPDHRPGVAARALPRRAPSRRRGDQGEEEPRPRAIARPRERRGDVLGGWLQLQGFDGTFDRARPRRATSRTTSEREGSLGRRCGGFIATRSSSRGRAATRTIIRRRRWTNSTGKIIADSSRARRRRRSRRRSRQRAMFATEGGLVSGY